MESPDGFRYRSDTHPAGGDSVCHRFDERRICLSGDFAGGGGDKQVVAEAAELI
ncbi:MAG: hypothetical protein ACXADX_20060 [Candidatus Hodarchaeales archaeon]